MAAATPTTTARTDRTPMISMMLLVFAACSLLLIGCGTEGDDNEVTAGADEAAKAASDATEPSDAADSTARSEGEGAGDPDGTGDGGANTTETTADDASETTATTGAQTTTTTEDTSETTLDPGTTTKQPPTTTTTEPGGSGDALVDQVIGMGESEAIALVQSTGRGVRVADRDGELFMLTADYDPERLNLSVNGGVVTAVRLG